MSLIERKVSTNSGYSAHPFRICIPNIYALVLLFRRVRWVNDKDADGPLTSSTL